MLLKQLQMIIAHIGMNTQGHLASEQKAKETLKNESVTSNLQLILHEVKFQKVTLLLIDSGSIWPILLYIFSTQKLLNMVTYRLQVSCCFFLLQGLELTDKIFNIAVFIWDLFKWITFLKIPETIRFYFNFIIFLAKTTCVQQFLFFILNQLSLHIFLMTSTFLKLLLILTTKSLFKIINQQHY